MKNQEENQKQIFVYDRQHKELIKENILGDIFLRLAYHSPLKTICNWILFKNALLTRLLGKYCDSKFSKGKIAKTIKELNINTEEIAEPINSFQTFNEFFYRKLKPQARPFDTDPTILCSPADSRVSVLPRLDENLCIPVKGAKFTISELLEKPHEEVSQYDGGVVMVFRLCPADYHRFHFPANGEILKHWRIDGQYHSVNPFAIKLGIKIYQHNVREITLLNLEKFGQVAYIEVGAFGVAGIENTHNKKMFKKMDEKGYFKFGGSTIILIFEPNRVCIDHDLEERSSRGIETLIHAGEHIADLAISENDQEQENN